MRKKRIHYFIPVLLCVQLQACLQIKKKGPPEIKEAPPTEVNSQQAPPSVDIDDNLKHFETRLEGSRAPHEYRLHIRRTSSINLPLRVQRSVGESVETKDLPLATTEWSEEGLRSGQQVRLDLGFVVQGRFQVADTLVFKVPLDFEFPEKLDFNEESLKVLPFRVEQRGDKSWLVLDNYERVFFPKNSETLVRDWNLEIKTKNIYFDRSFIFTHPEGSKAPGGKEGRSGGRLHFEADSASGQVRIEMRGEHGGDGLPGDPPDHRNRGTDRPNHVAPSFYISTLPCSDSVYCFGLQTTYHCTSPVPPGLDGEDGRQGHPGKPGGPGGNTGKLNFQVRNFEDLDLLVLNEVGRGGLGGQGGEGGHPGSPGLAWKPAGNTVGCSAMIDGRPGSRGGQGLPGTPGPDGRVETSCYPLDGKMNCLNK